MLDNKGHCAVIRFGAPDQVRDADVAALRIGFLQVQRVILLQPDIFQVTAFDVFPEFLKAFIRKFFVVKIPLRGSDPVEKIQMDRETVPVHFFQ